MSFQIPRDENGNIIKKNVSFIDENPADIVSQYSGLGIQSGTKYTPEFSSLTIGTTKVNISGSQISYVDVSAEGIAENSKGLILDSDKSISGINNVVANSVTINGDLLVLPSVGEGESSTYSYLTDIVDGVANSKKVLVPDKNLNIDNLKSVYANTIVKNKDIELTSNLDKFKSFNNLSSLGNKIVNSVVLADKITKMVSVGFEFIAYSSNSSEWTVIDTPGFEWESVEWDYIKNKFYICASTPLESMDRFRESSDGITWDTVTYFDDKTSDNFTKIIFNEYTTLVFNDTKLAYYYDYSTDLWNTITSDVFINEYSLGGIEKGTILGYDISSNKLTYIHNSDGSSLPTCVSIDFMNGTDFTYGGMAYGNNCLYVINNFPNATYRVYKLNTNNIVSMDNVTYSLEPVNSSEYIQLPPSYISLNLKFISELGLFITYGYGNYNFNIFGSYNGINWFGIDINSIKSIINVDFNKKNGSLYVFSGSKIFKYKGLESYISNIKPSIFSNFRITSYNTVYSGFVGKDGFLLFSTAYGDIFYSDDHGNSYNLATINDNITNHVFYDFAYSPTLDMYILISNNYRCTFYSTDGKNWIKNDTMPLNYYRVVIWNPITEEFMLYQYSSTVYKSTDGINWSSYSSNETFKNINKSIYIQELDKFILTTSSVNGFYVINNDGLTATFISTVGETKGVAWSPELSTAVISISNGTTTERFVYSTDLVTWTKSTALADSGYPIENVQWSSYYKVFVAFANVWLSDINILYYSYDGINWTRLDFPMSYRRLNVCIYDNYSNSFIVGNTQNNENQCVYSTDSNNLSVFESESFYEESENTINLNHILYKNNKVLDDSISHSTINSNKLTNMKNLDIYTNRKLIYYFYNDNINYIWSFALNELTNKLELVHSTNSGVSIGYYRNEIGYCSNFDKYTLIPYFFYNGALYVSTTGTTGFTTYSLNSTYFSGPHKLCDNYDLTSFVSVNNVNNICVYYLNSDFSGGRYSTYFNDNSINIKLIAHSKLYPIIISSSNRLFLWNDIKYDVTNNDSTSFKEISISNVEWLDIAQGNGYVIIISSTLSLVSLDEGLTWNEYTLPTPVSQWKYIKFVPQINIFILFSNISENYVRYSYDGVIWHYLPTKESKIWINCYLHLGSKKLSLISDDGIDYTGLSLELNISDIVNIDYTGITEDGQVYIYTPNDTFEYKLDTRTIGFYDGVSSDSIYTTMGSDSGGGFYFSQSGGVNIKNHNGIDKGLSFNGNLLLSNAEQLNYLVNSNNKNDAPASAIIYDDNNNINNINELSCNILTYSYLNSVTLGKVGPLQPAILDSNKNISGFSSISINNLKINNNTFYNKKNNNIINSYTKFSNSDLQYVSYNVMGITWMNDLNVFLCGDTYGYVKYSSDGVIWSGTGKPNGSSHRTGFAYDNNNKILYAVSNKTNSLYSNLHYCTDTSSYYSWTVLYSPRNIYMDNIMYVPTLKKIYIISRNSDVFTIEDNICTDLGTGNVNLTTILWNNTLNKFIGYTNTAWYGQDKIFYSTDALTWLPYTSTQDILYSISDFTLSKDENYIIATCKDSSYNTVNKLNLTTGALEEFTTDIPYYFIKWAGGNINSYILGTDNTSNYKLSYSSDLINYYSYGDYLTRIIAASESNGKFIIYNYNSTHFKVFGVPHKSPLSNKVLNINNIRNEYNYVYNKLNNWYNRSVSDLEWNDICYGKDKILLISNGNISYSTTGLSWTDVEVSGDWLGCTYGNDLYLIFSVNSIAYSSDCITWNTVSVSGSWKSCAFGNDIFMICEDNNIAYSSDCITWINIPLTGIWNSCSFGNEIFIISGYNSVVTSSDCITWTSHIGNDWNKIIHNQNIYIGVKNGTMSYSFDLATWKSTQLNNNWNDVIYIDDLCIYIALSLSPNYNKLAYSLDGITWHYKKVKYQGTLSKLCYNKNYSSLVLLLLDTDTKVLMSPIIKSTEYNTYNYDSSILDIRDGNITIGYDTYDNDTGGLNLKNNSAAKASTATWTVVSDERIKENIEDANLDLCYNNLDNLRLVKYNWKDNLFGDKPQLGWIAQEVENYYPNSVESKKLYGIEDCKTLNNSQIIASMYGAIKKLINNIEEQQSKKEELNNKYNLLKKFFD